MLWGALSLFALLGANRSADGLRPSWCRSMSPGEPRVVGHRSTDTPPTSLDHRGLAVSITLAVVLGVIALSAYLPRSPGPGRDGGGGDVAVVIWVLGQNFGEVFSGSATDPNTGPLLALLALAYWRRRPGSAAAPGVAAGPSPWRWRRPCPTPPWLAYTFAVVMVAVSLYCVAWLIVATRRSRQNHVDVNVSHVAMGLGMAGMLVPRLNLLPDGVWEAVFVAIALWFSWQGVRFVDAAGSASGRTASRTALSHYLIHLVMALAMLYMYLAAVPGRPDRGRPWSMTGPTGAGANFVGLPLLFVVILFASAVWQLDGLSRFAPSRPNLVAAGVVSDTGSATTALAPRLEMGCHIAMCITMGYMLVLML